MANYDGDVPVDSLARMMYLRYLMRKMCQISICRADNNSTLYNVWVVHLVPEFMDLLC